MGLWLSSYSSRLLDDDCAVDVFDVAVELEESAGCSGVVELLISEMTELESAIGEEELLRLFTLDEPGTGAVCELEISENSTEEDKNCAGGRLLEFSWGPIDDELSLI